MAKIKEKRGWREQSKNISEKICGKNMIREKFSTKRENPWLNLSKIKFEEAQVKSGNEKVRVEKQKIVEEMIKRSWNPECMEIYIDGSVEEGTTNGGAGYIIRTRNG